MVRRKECSGCGEKKALSQFGKCKKSKDGLNYICSACSKERAVIYRRSIEGLISKTYSHQKQSSKKRGHEAPIYTKRELLEYAKSSEEFMNLFEEWCSCGYTKYDRPSFDRLDDNKGYSFNNIQVVTWRENQKKQTDKSMKAVDKYSLDGRFICDYRSVKEASYDVCGDERSSNICHCCTGRYKTAFGFVWRYKE